MGRQIGGTTMHDRFFHSFVFIQVVIRKALMKWWWWWSVPLFSWVGGCLVKILLWWSSTLIPCRRRHYTYTSNSWKPDCPFFWSCLMCVKKMLYWIIGLVCLGEAFFTPLASESTDYDKKWTLFIYFWMVSCWLAGMVIVLWHPITLSYTSIMFYHTLHTYICLYFLKCMPTRFATGFLGGGDHS